MKPVWVDSGTFMNPLITRKANLAVNRTAPMNVSPAPSTKDDAGNIDKTYTFIREA
jgi:hypothetical protein